MGVSFASGPLLSTSSGMDRSSREEKEWLRRRAKTQQALTIVLDRLALLDTPAAMNLRTTLVRRPAS